MNLVSEYLLSFYLSFFSHLVTDWSFFSLNNLQRAKSKSLSMTVIVNCIADVETELNKNSETNKESEYSIEVLRVLEQDKIEKTNSESFWRRIIILFSELESVLRNVLSKRRIF